MLTKKLEQVQVDLSLSVYCIKNPTQNNNINMIMIVKKYDKNTTR